MATRPVCQSSLVRNWVTTMELTIPALRLGLGPLFAGELKKTRDETGKGAVGGNHSDGLAWKSTRPN
eukprot:3300822-Rhodomonas_salina.1